MEDTGERLIPGASDPDQFNEHLARYRFAESMADGRRVLDAGCGVGYGAALLADVAAAVFALDREDEAMRHGREHHPDVQFVGGDCEALPFTDDSLDLVVAFEVIEHLSGWGEFLRESARVLTPSGVLLVSTPNRPYYRASRQQPNPYHVHEFDYAELRGALEGSFDHCAVYLENHTPAITLTSDRTRKARVHFEGSASDPEEAHFFVGVCSQEPTELPPSLAYVAESGNVLRVRESHINKLKDWVAALESRHAEVERTMSRELSRLPYRILRTLRLAPRLPDRWAD